MQKITNLIICVLYNCNFSISVKLYIGCKFNQVDFEIFFKLLYVIWHCKFSLYIELRVLVK